MCRSNPLPSTLPSSPFCSTLNTSSITASDMCEVCTEAVHSALNTSYITGFAVCSYLTHLWCSYSSPKTRISVFLFDAFVVFLFEPGPMMELVWRVWLWQWRLHIMSVSLQGQGGFQIGWKLWVLSTATFILHFFELSIWWVFEWYLDVKIFGVLFW